MPVKPPASATHRKLVSSWARRLLKRCRPMSLRGYQRLDFGEGPVDVRASDVADAEDFVAAHAPGRVHVGGVALGLADQRACDRRVDRDLARLDVGLVVADDLICLAVAALEVLDLDGGAE